MRFILIIFVILNLSAKENMKNEKVFSCSNKKKYCKQMTSCEEAMFYLQQCGLKRLDRDKDGIPCERICKGK